MYISADNIFGVIIAVIGGGCLIVAACIPFLVSIRKHVKAAAASAAETTVVSKQTRYAVTNDHPKNLRDDLDEKFNGLETQLKGTNTRLTKLEKNSIKQGNQINTLFRSDQNLADEIEKTRPPIRNSRRN